MEPTKQNLGGNAPIIDNEHIANVWDTVSEVMHSDFADPSSPYSSTNLFFDFIGQIAESERVLDVGCAAGVSTRRLVERFRLDKGGGSGNVFGVDLSTGMIEVAKKLEKKDQHGIKYFVSDAANMSVFKDEEFDLVVSIMALMDMADLKKIFSEIYRILSKGGKVSFSTRHPCFVTPHTKIIRGNSPSKFHLLVGGYFTDGGYLEKTKFSGKVFNIPRPNHTLSSYLNAIAEAGFKLTKIVEPRMGSKQEHRNTEMDIWYNEAALRLFVEAVK